MKTSNNILKNLKLDDLDNIFKNEPKIKICRGGRYFAIGDKWVTSDALASRIQTLAKTLKPKDQERFDHLVDHFIDVDKKGYQALKNKISKGDPFSSTMMKGVRFFKTLSATSKLERHQMLLGYIAIKPNPTPPFRTDIQETVPKKKEPNIFKLVDQVTEKEHQEPIKQLKRYYLKLLDSSTFNNTNLNAYPQKGALYSYLEDLKQYRQMLNETKSPLPKNLNQVIDELEYAYTLSRLNWHINPEAYLDLKNSILEELQNKIKELPPSNAIDRQCVMIPGGWARHAIMYKIERNQDSTLSFTIINTGEGAVLNPNLKSGLNLLVNQKTIQDVIYSNLTMDHLSKPFLLKIINYNREFPDMNSNNQFIEKSLMKNGTEQRNYGRKHKEQEKGSCAFKSISSILHEKLGGSVYNRFKTFSTELEIKNLEKLDVGPQLQNLKEAMLAEGRAILQNRRLSKQTNKIFESIADLFQDPRN
jgi:hypothetical protein